MTLPAPGTVSPLIKFGRYSFLGLGIMYGAFHQSRLAAKEVKVREIEAKQKEVRDAKLAIEKKRNFEEEQRAIAALSAPTK